MVVKHTISPILIILFYSGIYAGMNQLCKIIMNQYSSSSSIPWLTQGCCFLISFYSIWLLLIIQYPLDKSISFYCVFLSVMCILLSKEYPSILFLILSGILNVFLVQVGIGNESLLSQYIFIRIIQLPSISINIWDILISVCIWKNPYLQVLCLSIVLLSLYYKQIQKGIPYLSLIACLITSTCSMSFHIDFDVILKCILIIMVIQIQKPSWLNLLLFLSCIFQSRYSFISIVFTVINIIEIIRILFSNCHFNKTPIPVLIANSIILICLFLLFSIYLTSYSSEETLFEMSSDLYQEMKEMVIFLQNNQISSFYVNHKDICYSEEDLYYYLLGLPYNYILITPFDKRINCKEMPIYAQLLDKVPSYLVKLYSSKNQSFILYHFV